MPVVSGLNSGSVPFVWRLFPRHPGYVMTVCALAIAAHPTTTSTLSIAFILRGGAVWLFLLSASSLTLLLSSRCMKTFGGF